jgi:hypothetical protein
MHPPEEVNTTLRVPAALADCKTLIVPMMLIIASLIGSLTDLRTST